MKIQSFKGGLANQIREYVFVRGQERRHPGEQWIYDDSCFFGSSVSHNGYELECVFGLKLNLLSNQLKKNQFEKLVAWKEKGISVPRILLATGIPVVLVSGFKENDTSFHGMEYKSRRMQTFDLPYTNVYYEEYWVGDEWFWEFQEENRSELAFPPLTEPENQGYAEEIQKRLSVGIHVRRTDFVTIGWDVPVEEYYAACKRATEDFSDVRFFVFSDDLPWCEKHAEELGFNLAECTTYVKGNTGIKAFRDMQLLSMCRGIIHPAQSSFSQVAAWLNRNLLFEMKLGGIFE